MQSPPSVQTSGKGSSACLFVQRPVLVKANMIELARGAGLCGWSQQ